MKTRFAVMALASALILPGCSSGPEDVLEEMHDKMCKDKSFRAMAEYAAPESQAIINMIVAMSEDPNKSGDIKKELKQRCSSPFKTTKVEKNGDYAKVYTFDNKDPIEMRKVDGKWKMVIRK